MRNILLAAVAAAALATPALARDGAPYIGIEGGIVQPQDFDLKVRTNNPLIRPGNGFTIDMKKGLDADVLAGYDFGLFRLEGELGYKKLVGDTIRLDNDLADDLGVVDPIIGNADNGRVWSLMANGLLDFGNDDGLSGYIGAGLGRARVKFAGDRDSAFAGQIIAGVRQAITPNLDLGVKYRYFRTARLNFGDSFDDGTVFGASGKLRTHSLLASLIYNFAAPVAPVVVAPVVETPPPPPAPATQTCYDGSVILATDVCPQPPVETPPPPPAPVPERG
jgi:opacity protein-like surface antigen